MKSPGTRSRCQFALSKGSPPPLTHNQRSVRKHPTLRILLYQGKMIRQHPLHFRFPPMLVSMHSILMTPMVMAHQQLPQFMNLILIRLLVMSPRPILPFLLVPFLLVLPPSRWLLIPKHQHLHHPGTFHQLPLIHLVLHHFAHGPLLTIKSWWVWNRTQSPVLRGSRSAPDSIVIPRYANWDGASWNKVLGLLTTRVEQIQPSTMRRMTNQLPCSVIAGKDVSLPACSLKQFQFLSLLFFVRVSPSPPVVCALFSFSLSLP